MPDTFIHIGMPKTGSTFLQTSVFPKLEGFHFIPRKQLVAMDAYSQLLAADDSLYREERLIEWRDALPEKPFLLSDESLSGKLLHWQSSNRSQVARRLQRLFPDAKILLVLRGQQSLILSMYKEYLKRPHATLNLPELLWFPNKMEKDKQLLGKSPHPQTAWFDTTDYRLHLESFKYLELIQLYQSLFKKVTVLLYEDLIHQPEQFFGDLAHYFHLSKGEGKRPHIENQAVYKSPDMREMRIKRWVNGWRKALPSKVVLAGMHRIGRLVYHPGNLDWEAQYIRQVCTGYFDINNLAVQQVIGQLDRYPEAYSQASN
ncbi:MAG: hypothetical protein AAFV80_06830 [Bacteroidota bacterium]